MGRRPNFLLNFLFVHALERDPGDKSAAWSVVPGEKRDPGDKSARHSILFLVRSAAWSVEIVNPDCRSARKDTGGPVRSTVDGQNLQVVDKYEIVVDSDTFYEKHLQTFVPSTV